MTLWSPYYQSFRVEKAKIAKVQSWHWKNTFLDEPVGADFSCNCCDRQLKPNCVYYICNYNNLLELETLRPRLKIGVLITKHKIKKYNEEKEYYNTFEVTRL